jgi:membrane protein required for colicin V production
LNKSDIVLIILLLLGAWSGYRKGFVMALFSLAAFILGIIGAFRLMGNGVAWLATKIDADPKLLPYLSFIILFILIVIAVRLLGSLLQASISKTLLGEADQILGAVLGILRYAFMISVLIWIFTSLHIHLPEDWRKNSFLLPTIEKTAPFIAEKAGALFPSVEDLFKEPE